jgi:hypothetical protein
MALDILDILLRCCHGLYRNCLSAEKKELTPTISPEKYSDRK